MTQWTPSCVEERLACCATIWMRMRVNQDEDF